MRTVRLSGSQASGAAIVPVRTSWVPEVIADASGTWCGNKLSFRSKPEAEGYARDLAMRWTSVRDWRVRRIAQLATHRWQEDIRSAISLPASRWFPAYRNLDGKWERLPGVQHAESLAFTMALAREASARDPASEYCILEWR